jgi:hypothetical protein
MMSESVGVFTGEPAGFAGIREIKLLAVNKFLLLAVLFLNYL